MLRIGVLALALAAGVIAWIATGGEDGGSGESASAGFEPAIVSLDELEELAEASGHAVYWAGPIPGKAIEASETRSGNVQIRYVGEGAEAGRGRAASLTIGSYPLPDPEAALDGFAERKGSQARTSPGGREVVRSIERPTSAYFVGADGDVQVEVYDPDPRRAMKLALSERVQPVG